MSSLTRIVGLSAVLALGYVTFIRKPHDPSIDPDAPVSVNYFPSRKCNYECGFCFHTDTSSFILPLDDAKRGLLLLKEAGMRKLNIAGGEPFLNPKFLGQIVQYCKEELHLESVSIVSNGSKVHREWLRKHAGWLDILAISCDSFDAETNKKIGRGTDGGNVMRLRQIAAWCREFGIKFKMNTVVNAHNWDENMAKEIEQLDPFRWKVFQCLIVPGENDDETRLRDARGFLVADEQWQTFCSRHEHLKCYVPEDNASMSASYLNLDEKMRFLDKGEGKYIKSNSILDVGVKKAMQQVVWDKQAFKDRGGIFDWGREEVQQEGGCAAGGGGAERGVMEW